MHIVLPALTAGLMAVAVTVLIERNGGVVGGLLGTLPTTIVPAAAGIWWAAEHPEAFRDAMGAVPVGMAVDGLFLYAWRVLPPALPGSDRARLVTTSVLSLSLWFGVALIAAFLMATLRGGGVAPLAVGVVAFTVLEAFGVWVCRTRVAAPRGSRPVGPATLVARAGLAALAIGASTLLADSGSALLAGMASVFPAIFLTTMVSLWWSQGESVPVGAVGPMILGSGAVSAFALAAALLVPALGLAVGGALAWVAAAGLVTVPAWWFLTLSRP